jgi:septal ring factor EnvC (AmiA/AmiB activator)
VLSISFADFCNREEKLNNNLKNTEEKVRSLEVTLREVEVGGQELKRAMKEAADSEYVVSQKLVRNELERTLRSNLRWL